ncbi:MAG: ubiquitin-like domain-containing protein [Dehalococcoidia bacterium]
MAALLVAIVVPITRTHAGADAPSQIEAELRTAEAVSSVLRLQAESISGMMAPTTASTSTLAEQSNPASVLIPQPLLSAVARLASRGVLGGGDQESLRVPLSGKAIAFTLHENGLSARQTTPYETVGDALTGAGIKLGAFDKVSPPADSVLTAGMHVYIDYATKVRFVLGDDDEQIDTQATTVGGVLAEHGIRVFEDDIVFPALSAKVRPGMLISLTMIRDIVVNEDEPILFRTISRYDNSIDLGDRVVSQEGTIGVSRRSYTVHMINGREVTRKYLSAETIAPTNEIVLLGTKVDAGVAPALAAIEGECASYMTVWSTYYTAISAGGNGITATGTTVYKGIIATDPTVIPLGTRMFVPGYGYGIAADTGGGVKGAHIDLGYGANDVYDWGSKYIQICILN